MAVPTTRERIAEPISTFSLEQVSRLTGLSLRQLKYWDETGFYTPRVRSEVGRPYGRIYAFADVVALRAIALLMHEYGIPLGPQLRSVGIWLAEHPFESWSSLKFYVSGHQVFFRAPDADVVRSARNLDQSAIEVQLEPVIRDMQRGADRLSERSGGDFGSVTRHRHVVHNAPKIQGTRIQTSTIREFAEAGYTPEQILEQYPSLTLADIEAAIAYEAGDRTALAAG